jgi:hypothetical protein
MKSITFKSWLFRQHKRNDRVGDLARDVRADYRAHCPDDPSLPGRFTYKTALDYFRRAGACQGAYESLAASHREWQLYRHGDPEPGTLRYVQVAGIGCGQGNEA